MGKRIKRQRTYEAGQIALLAAGIGFYVLILVSMHNAKYGNIPPRDNALLQQFASIMGKAGFSAEAVNAVSIAGKEECIIALFTFILSSAAVMCYCNKRTPAFLKRKHGILVIGLAIAAIAVVLGLNGTSLHCWADFFQSDKPDAPLWGITRAIRSDEYGVWTPMAVSQELAGFPAVSNTIGGGGTDATWVSVGGIPAINKALVFKPLYWGFILFGSTYGMSILWVGRSFLLFFTAYYCAMACTDGKKHFSFAAASMILFAPYMQWWFSQSIAEIVIYPGLIFLAWRRYLACKRVRGRIALSILMAWLLGCLAMIGYPGWIIPMTYLLVGCVIYDCVKKRSSLSIKDLCILVIPLLIAAGWLGLIAYDSRETLMAVSNSAYPGKRLYAGGVFEPRMTFGLQAMMLPFTDAWIVNSCELSSFISFAPVGAVLTIYTAVKNKKLKTADTLLIAVELAILFIVTVGIPAGLAKITLLSMCTRLEYIYGIVDIILLVRALSSQERLPRVGGMILTAMITLMSVFVIRTVIPDMGIPTLCLITTAYFLCCLTILVRPFQYDRKRYNRFISCCIVMLMIIAGAFVNPVQKGVYAAYRTDMLESLQAVDDEEGDLYLCEGIEGRSANYVLMAGKRVFNSTQEYANTEKWKALDPNGEYTDCYNRFCNITTDIVEGKTEFDLRYPDYTHINLSIDDLQKIGIKYLVSQKDYTEYHGVAFEKVGEGDGWKIYRLSY